MRKPLRIFIHYNYIISDCQKQDEYNVYKRFLIKIFYLVIDIGENV